PEFGYSLRPEMAVDFDQLPENNRKLMLAVCSEIMLKVLHKSEGRLSFPQELESVINRNSKENVSNTPDFILAQYLESCLLAFDTAVQQRETWYGRDPRPAKAADISSLDTPTVA